MAKLECQLNRRPADLARQIGDELRLRGRVLTDSSSYMIGGVSAHFQVWGQLSLLVIGSGSHSTVTVVSDLSDDIDLVEAGLGL